MTARTFDYVCSHVCRRRASTPTIHTVADTDTENTPPHCQVGGLEKFSHGVYHLVHQHWVLQAEHAGGFNVHNVEAAEAFHKLCMTLPAHRVRHYANRKATYLGMQKYLLHHQLFCSLKKTIAPVFPQCQRGLRPGIAKLLDVEMGTDISVSAQQQVLHREVRLARVELLDLLCLKLKLPCSRSSYTRLCTLNWKFAQKLTCSNGAVYWATDSQYLAGSLRHRRDNLLLHGSMPHEGDMGIRDALCCRAICFIELDGFRSLRHARMPKDLLKEAVGDTLTLILVRWFEPHPVATKRDSQHLPICPSPFDMNHAL